MARRITSGLPRPLDADPQKQRWYEAVAQAVRSLESRFLSMEGLADEFRRQGISTGGTTTTTNIINQGVDSLAVDACTIPPVPGGFVATGGLGIVILDWDNPFRYCSNHGETRVIRGTTDVFGDAIQIGTSVSTVYVDDTVTDDADFYYWIRWVTNDTVPSVGQPTDSAMVHTSVDPEEAIAALTEALENDPLATELSTPTDPLLVADRLARQRARIQLLLNNVIAGGQESRISVLDAGGFVAGETPNTFDGTTLTDAEAALDDYTDDAANAAWLAGYDDDATKYVVLEFD